jgi:hypothetical protein
MASLNGDIWVGVDRQNLRGHALEGQQLTQGVTKQCGAVAAY